MRPSSMTPGHARTARLAYLAIVLVATLSNLHFDSSTADVAPRLARALAFTPHMSDAIDAARNVLLFAGLGAVWIATSRLRHPGATLLRITLISFVLSGCVETLQLFSPVREASLIDVTTDTIGGLVGGLVTLAAFAALDESAGERSVIGIPAFVLAISYGLATVMEAFIPLFRQDLLPQLGGSVSERIGRAIAAIRPESIAQIPFTDVLIFFPAGVFAAAALMESGAGASMSALVVIVAAAVVYPVTEIVHGVAAEPIILGAALTHVVAAAAGAVVAISGMDSFRTRLVTVSRVRVVATAYSLILLVWSWRPFRLDLTAASMADQFTSSHIIPLQALAERGDLFSVTDVVTQGVIFFPLGALLAIWPLRKRGALRGVLPAIYLAIVLELGKIPIAERFMDVTHILIQSAGAGLGFVLIRRLGYKVRGEMLPPRPDSATRSH
ncbi:MAG: VanZ family protein [Gemmatimonadaceae bacterium]